MIRFTLVLIVVCFSASAAAQGYIPIKKGESSPIDGVVMTETKVERIALEKIELKEVKAKYSIDKETWAFKETNYNKGLLERDELIKEQRKALDGWWHRHKLEVGIVIGVVGAVGVAYGMQELFRR